MDFEQQFKKLTEYFEVATEKLPGGVNKIVKGYDFNNGVDYSRLLDSYATTGIQASLFAKAVEQINGMLDCKGQPLPEEEKADRLLLFNGRDNGNCTIFLAFTANMITSGVRETIRYLAEHNLVDVIVTSGGGIEEDIIKCLSDFYIGDFHEYRGQSLRSLGINRTGNMLVPNSNYDKFDAWFTPLLDGLLREQQGDTNFNLTPSKLIQRMGKEINNVESVFYWCYKNKIPVFCPCLTDGAIGDILWVHSMRNPGLKLDIIEDIRILNNTAMHSINTGMIILGGGSSKHHTCNANSMHNGANFAVFINTGVDYDASDSGALPDEAYSWGKINQSAESVKVHAEASIVFPLLVAKTFALRRKLIDNDEK